MARETKPHGKASKPKQGAKPEAAPEPEFQRFPGIFITSKDDMWKDYDPEKVRQGLRESAGAFAGLDTEEFKQYLRRARGHTDDEEPD